MNNLSLPDVNKRLAELERVVSTIAKTIYYDDSLTLAASNAFVSGGCVIDPADIFASGGFVSGPGAALEQENRGLKAQVEHLREQRDKIDPILELKDQRIMELEGQALAYRQRIELLELDVEEAKRDAVYWQSESASADDYAANIQNQLDDLRGRIAGLI